jgi:hypothetical protein
MRYGKLLYGDVFHRPLNRESTLALAHGDATIVWNFGRVNLYRAGHLWNRVHFCPDHDIRAGGFTVDIADGATCAWEAVIRVPGMASFDCPSTPVAIARALRAEGVLAHVPDVVQNEHNGRWRITGLSAREAVPSPCSFHIDYRDGTGPVAVLHSAILHTIDRVLRRPRAQGRTAMSSWERRYVVRPTLHPARDTAAARSQHRWLVEMATNSPDHHYWALVLQEVNACTVTTAYLKSCGEWSLEGHAQHDRTVRDRVFAVHLCAARLVATSECTLPPELWRLILGAVPLL